jgi:hypothetical protein
MRHRPICVVTLWRIDAHGRFKLNDKRRRKGENNWRTISIKVAVRERVQDALKHYSHNKTGKNTLHKLSYTRCKHRKTVKLLQALQLYLLVYN